MKFKESKEGYIGRFGEKKGKGDDVIILRSQKLKKQKQKQKSFKAKCI